MITRLLPAILLTLLIPDLYICLGKRGRRPPLALWLPLAFTDLMLLAAAGLLATNETFTPGNLDTIGIFIVAYMCIALPKTAYMLVSLCIRGIALCYRPIGQWATPLALVALTVTLGCIIYGTLAGPRRLSITHTDISSQRLPAAFDGYRIVQFSDVHLASFRHHPEALAHICHSINSQQPDLIVFTGDLVNIDVGEMQGFTHMLSQLRATDGVYSILGNHDYHHYARFLSQRGQAEHLEQLKETQAHMGWKLLLNSHDILRRGAESIVLAGVENDGKPPFPQRGDLRQALAGTCQEGEAAPYTILLSHDPSHWRSKVLTQTGVDLTLSGHTHGMQFMVGGWSPSAWFYPEWRGVYRQGQQALHVSLGVGGALIPFRFGAWPEINVITLHHK